MPLSLLVGILLIINGTPMTFKGQQHLTTLEGTEQVISQGPTAAIVPIKQLGTNGGGYFGVNSSHPLENPNAFTNMLECWSILILPMAMVFALGFYLKRRKLAWTIYGVMLFAYLVGITVSVNQEMGGNPQIAGMGISQDMGSMEGKEVRIGSAASAMWGMTTTVTSNGSVNSMHDSQTPLSGMLQMLNMQINCWFGGVGVGFMNYYAFLIIAVFISGLMVGRTPEFLGKKIEAREMKIATLVVLLHPFIILVGTALAAGLIAHNPSLGWLNNPSYHGLTYSTAFGKGAYITKATVQLMRDLGSIQAPQNAFLLNLGLETLDLRMERHCKNAQQVAEYLRSNDQVAWVHYPGLQGDKYYELGQKYLPKGSCGVIAFGLKGGREESIRFMDALKLCAIVTHVADARTSVLHPASHTHRQLTDEQLAAAGVAPDLIRLSVGIEDAGDIIADIAQALAAR